MIGMDTNECGKCLVVSGGKRVQRHPSFLKVRCTIFETRLRNSINWLHLMVWKHPLCPFCLDRTETFKLYDHDSSLLEGKVIG